jgi:hypothetical protein
VKILEKLRKLSPEKLGQCQIICRAGKELGLRWLVKGAVKVQKERAAELPRGKQNQPAKEHQGNPVLPEQGAERGAVHPGATKVKPLTGKWQSGSLVIVIETLGRVAALDPGAVLTVTVIGTVAAPVVGAAGLAPIHVMVAGVPGMAGGLVAEGMVGAPMEEVAVMAAAHMGVAEGMVGARMEGVVTVAALTVEAGVITVYGDNVPHVGKM